MMKRLLSDRRGVSLAEVVVAMAMILIISGAAISVQISSARADVAYRDKYQALSACENAVSCLRFADGDDGILADALTKAGFTQSEGVFTHGNGSYTVTVKNEGGRYVVKYGDEIIYQYD